MKPPKAIVITLDGWSANFLGPYGNTWVETSALNGLARDALLIEHAYADSVALDESLSSFWQGRHTLCQTEAPLSLGRLLASVQLTTHLVTDDETVAHHPLASSMSTVTYADVPASRQPAMDAMQTQFGQFIANAADTLEHDNSDCVWIHAKAFGGSWDAPFELRMALTDEEEDPDPTRTVDPPTVAAITEDDPDAAWNLARSYAAQVMSVDRCLEVLFDVIDNHPMWRDALLIVTSPRSFPLGEHGSVGLNVTDKTSGCLHGEALHVPLFIRSPKQDSLLLRSQAIVQPASVYGTLVEWFGVDWFEMKTDEKADEKAETKRANVRPGGMGAVGLMGLFERDNVRDSERDSERDPERDSEGDSKGDSKGVNLALELEKQLTRAVTRAGDDLSLRTSGWFLRTTGGSDFLENGDVELYVKPDDRWEANEVADRCPEIVSVMKADLAAYVEAAKTQQLDELAELPELLCPSTI